MRILYVGRNARTGGGSTFRFSVARGLCARGHEVWIACQPGEMVPRFLEVGAHYVWTPPAPWGGPWIARALRANKIDLVHASNATPGRAAEWACRRTGTPMVMSVHGYLGRKDHTASCLKYAKRILTFEEVAVEALQRHAALFDPGKILLLRRPILHRPGLPPEGGPFRVVGVGRLSRRKGKNALALIQAFERFQSTCPGSTLDLLGDGTLLRDVRQAAAEANARLGRTVVTVHGSVPDPLPLVESAHVLVGASYCALEALMQGIAVVGAGFWGYGVIDEANLRDAMRWNFGDVGGKWVMSAENFEAALSHLYQVWVSGNERTRYWGLERLISEEHSADRVVDRLLEIYQTVLGENSPRPLESAA